MTISAEGAGLLVRPDLARRQMDAETPPPASGGPIGDEPSVGTTAGGFGSSLPGTPAAAASNLPRRFHGTVQLDTARVGRDASRIADEVVVHLSGLVGAEVTVTLEIEANIPSGAPDHVVRTVTENARTLKFKSQGFEEV